MRTTTSPALGTAAVLTALVAGCSGPTDPAPTSARGTLTVNGRPAGGALVTFHPVGGGGRKATATTDAGGEFRPTTAHAGDGIVPGEYAVTLVWPDPRKANGDGTDGGDDQLRGRYRDPGRPFSRITVSPNQEPILLTVK